MMHCKTLAVILSDVGRNTRSSPGTMGDLVPVRNFTHVAISTNYGIIHRTLSVRPYKPMSENTQNIPPPPPPPPVTPRPFPPAGHRAPPHPPIYHQQPSTPSSGCAPFLIHGFIALVVFGIVGIGVLVGGFFLIYIATEAFDEIKMAREEKTLTEKFVAGNRHADDKIAIMTIEGVITSNADGFIAKQIRSVLSDTRVKAVVLRVESPGGTMSGSDYYLHLLKKMKAEREIPVVVSMGSLAASGGYYVSMVGDEIFAEPSTLTGSIGVIASLFNASELLEKIGVESTPITSGPHKAMGSFAKPMTEEERAIWQRLIDENFDRFKQIIREGRKKEFADNPGELDRLATGQIYTANEALANKLIDTIGFLDDAIDRASELADLASDYKAIQYKPKLSVMETLLDSRAPNTLLSGKTLTEVTTPKIYLLCPQVVPVGE